MRYVPLMFKNCWRNRRRTVLTVLSIGVSMCLLGVMVAMYHAFYMSKPDPSEASRLVTRNKISLTVSIPQSFEQTIAKTPGVRLTMKSNWFGGTFRDARDPKNQFARFAVEPEKLFLIYPEFVLPDDQKKAFIHERTACIIGRDLANAFGFKVGDRMNLTGDIFPGNYEFTIRGIFDSPRTSQLMYIGREYVEQAMTEQRRGQVGMFYTQIDDPAKSADIAAAIDDQFRNATEQTKTESEQAFTVGFLALLGNVKMFLIVIAGAVVFTVMLVSANTMAMSVRERVREVGVLKTLGFTNGAVLSLVLGEACLIATVGGSLGYLVSTFFMSGIAKTPFGGFLPAFSPFDPAVALACIAIAASIGLVSAFILAVGAARAPIVESLRSTD